MRGQLLLLEHRRWAIKKDRGNGSDRFENTHVPSNAPPIYDTRANACTHWTDPTNPTARVNVHLLSRFIQSIYPSIYPNTRLSYTYTRVYVCHVWTKAKLRNRGSPQPYRCLLLSNPHVRVELTKRKSFGQRSLDNRASEL